MYNILLACSCLKYLCAILTLCIATTNLIIIFVFNKRFFFQAGIQSKDLIIALEPEAASIYCQELRTIVDKKTDKTFSETTKKGTKYVVIDLGGKLKSSSLETFGRLFFLPVHLKKDMGFGRRSMALK